MDDGTPRQARVLSRWLSGWVPVFGWAALIFVASATPDLRFVADDRLDVIVRKLGHLGVFGLLALLAWRGVAMTTSARRPWTWAVALTILYAVVNEVHQGSVAGRSASAVDVGIDAAGALAAVGVIHLARTPALRVRR